jgi:dTMP kinase
MSGLFITFEGIEGCGKSTHVAFLAQTLREQGYEVVATREPGGTAIGKELRRLLLEPSATPLALGAELLMMLADRAQHVQEVVAPSLHARKIVISDRFVDSTTAYQGYGRGIEYDLLLRLNVFACGGCMPSLTILLDVPVEEGLRRAHMRRGTADPVDHFEAESIAFHSRVREGFLAVARAEPQRVHIIDGQQSIEEVRHEIMTVVQRCLSKP